MSEGSGGGGVETGKCDSPPAPLSSLEAIEGQLNTEPQWGGWEGNYNLC